MRDLLLGSAYNGAPHYRKINFTFRNNKVTIPKVFCYDLADLAQIVLH